ncbi:MAG: EamA family transporter RarD [Actinomycetaceae bacterium]|nr:EamA family transporter RarD [Actinomycetaceae bacterium]
MTQRQTNTGASGTLRTGYLYGLGAYGMWGLFPLFFALLVPAGALEVIAHRAWWALVFSLIAIVLTGRMRSLGQAFRDWRLFGILSLAGLLQAGNWTIYVWAVLNGHVLEASLGYFINPLVTVLLAIIFLRERLTILQVISLVVAAVAVAVFVIDAGRPPFISLGLAFSFGLYSLVKKQVGLKVGALQGLTVETLAVAPFALGYMGYLAVQGTSSLQKISEGGAEVTALGTHGALLVLSGFITLVPLVFFALAARMLPLSTVGMMQYMTPFMQFLLGWLVFGEQLSTLRWTGFFLIWAAIAVLTVHIVVSTRTQHFQQHPRSDLPPSTT